MSLADKIFVTMCQDILENGTCTEGEKVRPHWEDGTSAYTIKKIGVVNRYDQSKEITAITLRKTAIKTCTEERHISRVQRMSFFGYGRRNPTISMI